jgi:hypothetical protein
VIDMAKAIAEIPEDQRERVEASLEQLPDGMLPATVWIDDAGLVRRLELDLDNAGLGDDESATGSVSFMMELFDFGEPVAIDVPDEADVQDGEGLFGG